MEILITLLIPSLILMKLSGPELAPRSRAGMFAFCYSVGPSVLSALEDDIRERVRYLVGDGGYHDLSCAMRIFTAGWFEHDGKCQRHTPDDTARVVYALGVNDDPRTLPGTVLALARGHARGPRPPRPGARQE